MHAAQQQTLVPFPTDQVQAHSAPSQLSKDRAAAAFRLFGKVDLRHPKRGYLAAEVLHFSICRPELSNIAREHRDNLAGYKAAALLYLRRVRSQLRLNLADKHLINRIEKDCSHPQGAWLNPAKHSRIALARGGRNSSATKSSTNSDKREQAVEMRASGQSYGSIAKSLGLDKSSVYRWFHPRQRPTRAQQRLAIKPLNAESVGYTVSSVVDRKKIIGAREEEVPKNSVANAPAPLPTSTTPPAATVDKKKTAVSVPTVSSVTGIRASAPSESVEPHPLDGPSSSFARGDHFWDVDIYREPHPLELVVEPVPTVSPEPVPTAHHKAEQLPLLDTFSGYGYD